MLLTLGLSHCVSWQNSMLEFQPASMFCQPNLLQTETEQLILLQREQQVNRHFALMIVYHWIDTLNQINALLHASQIITHGNYAWLWLVKAPILHFIHHMWVYTIISGNVSLSSLNTIIVLKNERIVNTQKYIYSANIKANNKILITCEFSYFIHYIFVY